MVVAKLTLAERHKVKEVAVRMAKQTLRMTGSDPKDKAVFRGYWLKNRKLFMKMSKAAYNKYLGA